MRALLMLVSLLVVLPASGADYAREKKWADEILPAVLTGDPVWLTQANGHAFLGLHTPVGPARGAVVVVHGIGVHPDWGVVGSLRQRLADAGYATLSVQMPVLPADARVADYPPTFGEAAERLGLAVAFLKDKGHAKVAIVSHSLGCRMSYRYLAGGADPAVKAWAALSTPGTEDWSVLRLPVLDVYGENDLPHVLRHAQARAASLTQRGSRQTRLPGADHFFEGRETALVEAVKRFLDGVM